MQKFKKVLLVALPAGILFIWIFSGLSGIAFSVSDLFNPRTEATAPEARKTSLVLPPKKKSNFMVGGIQMNEPDQVRWVETLKDAGMNTLEVTVYAYQGRWNDNNLWYNAQEKSVLEEIRAAKKAGMNVVLILRLQMDHGFSDNDFLWHGMVFPETEYYLHLWFGEYTKFCKKWAQTCGELGVDVLVLGSEMNALFATEFTEEVPVLHEFYLNPKKQRAEYNRLMKFEDGLDNKYLNVYGREPYQDLGKYLEDQAAAQAKWAHVTGFAWAEDSVLEMNKRRATLNYYWETLIDEMRRNYQGKLTVASNFDNYREVKFWEKLDFIGINAYFPLRALSDTTSLKESFDRSWDRILDEVMYFQDTAGVAHLPVLFTELGYTNRSGSTLRPWQGTGFTLLEKGGGRDSLVLLEETQDFAYERNQAVRSLYQAVSDKNFPLAGILYWKMTTQEDQLQYDGFALHIGKTSSDTLGGLLSKFKNLQVGNLQAGRGRDKSRKTP